jgi:hypothetical protein
MGKKEPGGNVNQYNHCENNMEAPQKTKNNRSVI